MRLVVAAALAVAVHAMDTSDDPGEDITVVPNVSATRGQVAIERKSHTCASHDSSIAALLMQGVTREQN